MSSYNTIGLWLQQRRLLALVDPRSLLSEGSDPHGSQGAGLRLVATRAPKGLAPTDAGDDERRTTLAPWPAFHPYDLPMILPCSPHGIEVLVYSECESAPNSFDVEAQELVCDPTMELPDAEHWWVLSCPEQGRDPALSARAFDSATLVERSMLEQTPELSADTIIAAARSTERSMRRSSTYLVSPNAEARLGPTHIVSYAPRLPALRVEFKLEPTRGGTTQPIATIEATNDADIGDALANLCVFQLRRNAPACELSDLSFDSLGHHAHRIEHRRISTDFFAPVRTGDIVGVLGRGIALEPPTGSRASATNTLDWTWPEGVEVQITVRQEDGFVPLDEDIELVQSGRLGGLSKTLTAACSESNEQQQAIRLLEWVQTRIGRLARDTLEILDDTSLNTRTEAQLVERDNKLGFLLYPVSYPRELKARIEQDKPLAAPWGQVKGNLDASLLARCYAAISASEGTNDPQPPS